MTKERFFILKEFKADENTMLKDFLEVPAEYRNVRVSALELACRDALGTFDHSKISFSFIYDLGIYSGTFYYVCGENSAVSVEFK